MNIDQAKRLNWKHKTKHVWVRFEEIDGSNSKWCYCTRHMDTFWYTEEESALPIMFTSTTAKEILNAPTEKEMMEWLAIKSKIRCGIIWMPKYNQWGVEVDHTFNNYVFHSIELTETLVQACESLIK